MAENCLVSDQCLAQNVSVGRRIPSVKVLNQSDARPWHLQELLPSIGCWRVFVLPGDITIQDQAAKLKMVGEAFDQDDSFLRQYTPLTSRHDAVFELFVVHNAPRTKVTIFDFPPVFRHFDETDGWDYNKIFADDVSYHEGHGNMYEEFGISKEGCIMIIRPDQHISYVGSMENPAAVNQFFSRFMRHQGCQITKQTA